MMGNRHKMWCHFSQKYQLDTTMVIFNLNKRALKRQKHSQGDAKFSFLVVRKSARACQISVEVDSDIPQPWPVLIMPPLKRKQHVSLNVCSPSGIVEKSVVYKSHGEVYTAARKSKWGDLWPFKFQAAVSDFNSK